MGSGQITINRSSIGIENRKEGTGFLDKKASTKGEPIGGEWGVYGPEHLSRCRKSTGLFHGKGIKEMGIKWAKKVMRKRSETREDL